MDLKEQIIKFLNEETEQYRCTESGYCRAIGMDTKEDAEYLGDELIKLFSLHSVNQQRELLESFREKWNESRFVSDGIYESDIDDFLEDLEELNESNCD